jgi:hypothetical protein
MVLSLSARMPSAWVTTAASAVTAVGMTVASQQAIPGQGILTLLTALIGRGATAH